YLKVYVDPVGTDTYTNAYLVHGNGGYTLFTKKNSGAFVLQYTTAAYGGLSYESGTLTSSGGNYTFTAADQLQWNYNSSGKLTSVVHPSGITVAYTYSGDLLSHVDDPNGDSVYFTYTSGKLTSIERGYYVSTVFTVYATSTVAFTGNNLTSVTDDLGNVRSFTFDSASKMLTDSDPLTFTYVNGAVS